jgi:DNA-binding response OmpR family regulator/HPt (histidine-containing phosphotransfer) domain-containing protein
VRILLVVEDDETQAEMLSKYLIAQHYTVDLAPNGKAGWNLAEAFEYDVILLDVMLPQLDGISFCQQLRKQGNLTPILMLTAYDSSTDKVAGLDAGADDYVVKPYDFDELLARIRALLRRGNSALPPIIKWGNLRLDPSSCEVTYNRQLLRLRAKEYAILELFLRNTHRIFSQSALLDHLWSFDEPPLENTVRAHIKSLRRKLKEVGAEDLIETVYGLGYRLREISTVTNTVSQTPGQIPAELLSFWEKSYVQYSDRLTTLEQTVQALQINSLTETEQQQAARQAHTLIGSLGSFGLEDAAQLCRQIEQIFKEKIDPSQIAHLAELVRKLRRCLEKSSPNVAREAVLKDDAQLVVYHTASRHGVSAKAYRSAYPLGHKGDKATATPFNTTWYQGKAKPQLLIIDDDTELNSILIAEAKAWGIQAEAVTNLADARAAIAKTKPDIILLDLCFPDSTDNGLAFLRELANDENPVPVVVFTAQENFSDRLEVARLGAQSFLQKPIAPKKVINAIAEVLQQATTSEAKLLIVDDDPQMLDFLKTLLTPWGFNLTFLNDPQQFWQTLKQTTPDLLILDIEMPDINGLELCQVVRNDPDWSELPVLFLSVHKNRETIEQVFTVGGDDYVNKPIIGSELIARVLNRLERSNILRKLGSRSVL